MPQKIIEFLCSAYHEQKGKNSDRSFHTDYTIKYNMYSDNTSDLWLSKAFINRQPLPSWLGCFSIPIRSLVFLLGLRTLSFVFCFCSWFFLPGDTRVLMALTPRSHASVLGATSSGDWGCCFAGCDLPVYSAAWGTQHQNHPTTNIIWFYTTLKLQLLHTLCLLILPSPVLLSITW